MKKSALILLSFLFITCNEDNPIEYKEPVELIPTQIGNEWAYYSFCNDIIISYSEKILKDTILFDNEKWSVLLFPGNMAAIITNRSDGTYFLNEHGQPVLKYKYPASTNDFYIGDNNDTTKVLATNVKVAVQAGTFYCYQYLSKNEENEEFETFLSPGVGIVKTLHFSPKDDTINSRKLLQNIELQSYNF